MLSRETPPRWRYARATVIIIIYYNESASVQWSTKISVTPCDYFRGVRWTIDGRGGSQGTRGHRQTVVVVAFVRGRSIYIGGQDTAARHFSSVIIYIHNIITNLNKNNRDGPSEIKASDVNGDPENWTCATVSVLESFPVAPCVSFARAVKRIP